MTALAVVTVAGLTVVALGSAGFAGFSAYSAGRSWQGARRAAAFVIDPPLVPLTVAPDDGWELDGSGPVS